MSAKHTLLAIIAVLIWGFFPVICKLGLNHFPPMMIGGCRFLFASIPFVFIFKRPEIPFKHLAMMGCVLTVHTIAFMLALKKNVGAGMTSILMESQVFFTALLSILLLRHKINFQQIISLVIAFSGVVIIGSTIGVESGGVIGFILLLIAAFLWGINNVQMNYFNEGNALSLVVWISLFPPIPLFILSYFMEPDLMINALNNITFSGISIVLFLAVISGVGALWIWCHLLRKNEPTLVAPFALLSPVIGIIGSRFVFKEVLSPQSIIGSVLILSGLLYLQVVTYRKKRANLISQK
jgi:O-acetylserine/cysteine efflux transporter